MLKITIVVKKTKAFLTKPTQVFTHQTLLDTLTTGSILWSQSSDIRYFFRSNSFISLVDISSRYAKAEHWTGVSLFTFADLMYLCNIFKLFIIFLTQG